MRVVMTLAVSSAIGLAGCSSPPPVPSQQPGALVNGTALVTVNDAAPMKTTAVTCSAAGPLTTITTGDDRSGVTAVLSSQNELAAQSVSIVNLGGFTGSYHAGLGGETTVSMTGRTYAISGTADGFAVDNPSFRTSGTFTVKVAC